MIKAGSWKRPAVFDWLQEEGHIEDHEMYRVFNNGIGMAVIVAAEDAEKAQKALKAAGETVYRIGVIEAAGRRSPLRCALSISILAN